MTPRRGRARQRRHPEKPLQNQRVRALAVIERPSVSHPAPSPLTARRSGPLKGRVRVPGDKSISHRALILGALAVGETSISGLLEGEDVLNTGKTVRALGADMECIGVGSWRLYGVGVAG